MKKIVRLSCTIIDKTDHVKSDCMAAIGGLEGSAIGAGGVAVEEDAANDTPNCGRISAALACAVDGEDVAMFVKLV